jgi:protein involved in polysaccharide export with SLBB domain
MLGQVQAAGKTVSQLADDLTTMLEEYVINPVVSVIQIGGVPRLVSVLGAVQARGTYDVRQYPTVLTVLAAAGGATPEADMARALLVRDGERALIVKEVIGGEPVIPEDMTLQAGDAIIVPSLVERAIQVVGAVARPGLVALEEGLTASRAVLMAGGATETADLTRAQLLRGNKRIDLNLRPLLQPDKAREGEEALDVTVQLEDVLIVPPAHTQAVFLIGAVAAPGPQPANEARMASKAVVMAGGATINGDLSHAYVLRDGQQIGLELTPLLDPDNAPEGAEGIDASLQAGDVVVVPEHKPIFIIGAVNNPGGLTPHQARTVSNAIVFAGGLADDADKSNAYVLRQGEQIQVDLAALFDEGDASADLALEPLDALIVPRRPQVFHIVGQVVRPGTYTLEEAGTVLDAWALAGGPTLTGNGSECVLLRGENAEVLNVEALVNQADFSQNRTLQAGDTIVVPEIEDEVYVFGQVVRPGAHPIHEGDTVIDVIADAGGPTAMANVNAIALIRRRKVEEARRRELYGRPVEMERRTRERGGPPRRRPGRATAREEELTPEQTAERTRAEMVAEQLANGTEAIRLFDLAKVPPGDSRYLVHPGDVIYVPTVRVREREWRRILTQFITSLLAGALL